LHNTLENEDPANLLGGLGSGLTYAFGNTFMGLSARPGFAWAGIVCVHNPVTRR
jgi:hypothetical protein